MCVHGNLDLNKIQDVKAVDADLAEELYRETTKDPPDPDQPVAPRLTHEKLCELCVRNRCRSMKLARSLSVDHKYIQGIAIVCCFFWMSFSNISFFILVLVIWVLVVRI